MIYKSFVSQRCFGVELEASKNLEQIAIKDIVAGGTSRGVSTTHWQASKNNRNWHVKMDGSCGEGEDEYGWEIASYKARGVDDLVSIANVAQRLKKAGLRVNKQCGLHVHVEVNDFCAHRMGYLLARWLAVEPWLFNAVPTRRSKSVYCTALRQVRPVTDRKWTAWELWEHFKPEYKVYGSQDYRRVALNLCNFYMEKDKANKKRCTVELRLPEGTLRGVNVKNWTRFFVHLVETSAHDCSVFPVVANTLNEFFDACGIGHDGEFSFLSPGLRETKIWLLRRLKKYQFNRDSQAIDEYLHRMTWPEKLGR